MTVTRQFPKIQSDVYWLSECGRKQEPLFKSIPERAAYFFSFGEHPEETHADSENEKSWESQYLLLWGHGAHHWATVLPSEDLWGFWYHHHQDHAQRNLTQNFDSHSPNPHQRRKHGSWTSSSERRFVGSSSSSSSSSLFRCPLKIKGHEIPPPYANNSDTSEGACYLPHADGSSHIADFVLL